MTAGSFTDVPPNLTTGGALLLEVDLSEHPGALDMMLDPAGGRPTLRFTNAAHSLGNVAVVIGAFRSHPGEPLDEDSLYQNPHKIEISLDPVADRDTLEDLLGHSVLLLRGDARTGVMPVAGQVSALHPVLFFGYEPESVADALLALEPDLHHT